MKVLPASSAGAKHAGFDDGRPVPVSKTVALLSVLYLALLLPLVLTGGSTYRSGPDLHAGVEVVGSLLGLAAGLGFVLRFYALGSRLLLFIGLAFLVNAAEDFAHGMLSFRPLSDAMGLGAQPLEQFIRITDATAQALLGLLLIGAPVLSSLIRAKENRRHETVFYSCAATAVAVCGTVLAYTSGLPSFNYPNQFIARPVDLLTAALLGTALIVYARVYVRTRDRLFAWIALSLVFGIAGQVVMSTSVALYDAAFDLAHIYKVCAYLVPIVGFAIYQIEDTKRTRHARSSAESALREIGSIYDALRRHSIISITDHAGIITDVNEAFCRISGYERDELIGRSHTVVNSQTHPREFWVDLWETIESGKPWRGEICNRRRDGSLYWVDSVIVPHRGADGSIEKFVSMRFDVTARKSNEGRLAQAMSVSRIGLWDYDLTTRTAYLSDTYNTTLGYEPGELRMDTDKWKEICHPEDYEYAMAEVERHARGQTPVMNIEVRVRKKDGSWLWVREIGEVIERDAEGNPTRMLGLHLDIDESKRLDRALRSAIRIQVHESETETLNQLCKAVADVFGVMFAGVARVHERPDGPEATFAGGWHDGRAAVTMSYALEGTPCAVTAEEEFCLFESAVSERFPGDQILVDMNAESYAGLRLADSRGRNLGLLILVHDRPLRLGFDIRATMKLFGARAAAELERLDIENHMREAKERAVAASIAKSEFLANMSHEIRTPMTAIVGYADILCESAELSSGGGPAAEAIRAIRCNTDHLLAVINDILDVSKIEAGKMTVERIATNPAEILDEVVSFVSPSARSKGISLCTEYCGSIPQVVSTDPTRLRQILLNLVGNAVKFTDIGSVTVAVDFDPGARCLRFRVGDTGIGMTPPERDAIAQFRAFQQADSSMTRRFGGTGLGLRICDALATRLGGRIEVQSEAGKGSTFTLTIDTGEAAASSAAASLPQAAGKPTSHPVALPLRGIRILVAEDGPDNQRLFSYFLTRAGAEVEIVGNGRLACDRLMSDPPGELVDLVLMDMQMPEMDGYEATRLLRRNRVTVPIIAVTAHAMDGDRERCIAAGCEDYLTKPVSRPDLIRTCAEWSRMPDRKSAA